LPLALQRIPYWSPVLRRGFHDHFLHIARGKPLGQFLQLAWAGSELPAFKSPFAFDFYVRHGDRQHLLVNVDSRDPVWHTHLQAERRTCFDGLTQGHGLSHTDAQLFAQARTFRTIQFNGFNSSTGMIDLTARASDILTTAPLIFISFRELTSARGHALLQLFAPVLHDDDACRRGSAFGLDHEETTIG
jgi:hypothetical protein